VQLSLAWDPAIGPLGPFPDGVQSSLPLPVGVLALLGIWFSGMSPASAFGFATVFPRPLPPSRHLWWLFLLAPAITLSPAIHWLWLPVYGSAEATTGAPLDVLAALLGGMFFIAAVALLSHNYRRLEKPSERRRVRIVALGFGLTFLVLAVGMFNATPWAPFKEGGVAYAVRSQWTVVKIFPHAAAPVSMTYAILRHRVFDIQVIIRLGVQSGRARGPSIVPLTAVILGSTWRSIGGSRSARSSRNVGCSTGARRRGLRQRQAEGVDGRAGQALLPRAVRRAPGPRRGGRGRAVFTIIRRSRAPRDRQDRRSASSRIRVGDDPPAKRGGLSHRGGRQ
jgi:hypothetical protein